jgi:hypothetical protein
MRALTTGERQWMTNYISRGLEQLRIEVTPRHIERGLHMMDDLLRTASDAPPPPDLTAAIRAMELQRSMRMAEERQGGKQPPVSSGNRQRRRG